MIKRSNSFIFFASIVVVLIFSCNQQQHNIEKATSTENKSVEGDFDRTVLPILQHPFAGTLDTNASQSKSDFPIEVSAPKGAPNVLLILTDDVGYGAASTFGGPIATPTMDSLAANGIRYNEFHTTALCSPTRAALITGRNHHNVATGIITEMATGFDGYNSLVPKSAASVGEILKDNGWNTGWWGKMHNIPDWKSSAAGPFDLWPNGLGFEYFYGFVGGDAHQFRPALYENTTPVEPYINNPNYILDQDLANNCISYIRKHNSLAPQKPFFAYYCTGTAHAPHQAPKEWIDKYKGKFDQGWDKVREETYDRQKKAGVIPQNTKLTERNTGAPEWNTLSADQKKLYAREMEVYAGALAYADYNIGKVIQSVRETGQLDNTIIIYIMGDNGASAEGGIQGTTNEIGASGNGFAEDMPFLMSQYDKLGTKYSYGHYSYGWALAMDAPFQWTKQVASHFGGTRNGMVISYPKGMKQKGEVRSQFHHVIDIVPTILELCGVPQAKRVNGVDQKPMDGVSMAYTFNDAKAPSTRTTQYFELAGNRAIYNNGWVACTTPLRVPWVQSGSTKYPSRDFKWELYNIANDYSEANNIAEKNPDKLKELQTLFYAEAQKNNVFPLDASFAERGDPSIRPSLTTGRTHFEYYEGAVRIPEGSAPNFKNQSWKITADVKTSAKSQGVLATMGGYFGGFSLLIKNNKPMFMYRGTNQPQWLVTLQSAETLSQGVHKITIDFVYDGGGVGKGANMILSVDGKKVAQKRIERTIGIRFSLDETFDVGEDTGTPVEFNVYDVPFKFDGELKKVTVELRNKL
jgi:arylsulfatase